MIRLFELLSTDLLGRNGLLHTRKGIVRTPCFVPVVHPNTKKNLVDVSSFNKKFDIDFIITSSYILRKMFSDEEIDLHSITSFAGPIMTDSGAYQSLVYGEIEITPESAIKFQESIHSDFGVPLDIPISISDDYLTAKKKVDTTIERCRNFSKYVKDSTTKWVGPIQGGKYLDLIEKSAKAITKITNFSMFAIGSVVELMSNYNYDIVLEMILTAKKYLNPAIPLHLFGAGHPAMFPLIIAAGCDSFDSASYALYAQDDRYITNTQTYLLSELDEFPCSCPICVSTTPKNLTGLPKIDRMKALAEHNLYICQAEIRNIRRAISSGTLWDLIESRAFAHPELKNGFKILSQNIDQLIVNTPSSKKKGLFLVSNESLVRPEIRTHYSKIKNVKLGKRKKVIIISLINSELSESYNLIRPLKQFITNNEKLSKEFDFLLLDSYFGIIPLEISEAYPLVQYVSADINSSEYISQLKKSLQTIENIGYNEVFFIGYLELINDIMINNRLFSQKKIYSFDVQIIDQKLNTLKEILEQL